MSTTQAADEILDRTYLEMRSCILELAAALDRIERAAGGDRIEKDPRLGKIRRAIDMLNNPGFDRAEKMQLIFSDAYQADWHRPR